MSRAASIQLVSPTERLFIPTIKCTINHKLIHEQPKSVVVAHRLKLNEWMTEEAAQIVPESSASLQLRLRSLSIDWSGDLLLTNYWQVNLDGATKPETHQLKPLSLLVHWRQFSLTCKLCWCLWLTAAGGQPVTCEQKVWRALFGTQSSPPSAVCLFIQKIDTRWSVVNRWHSLFIDYMQIVERPIEANLFVHPILHFSLATTTTAQLLAI